MNKIKNTDYKNIKTYLDWLNKDQAFLAEFDITHIIKETDSHELNENVLSIKKDSNTKNWTNFKYAKSKKLLKLKNSRFNFYGHLNQALNNDIIVLMNCIEAYDKANSTNFLYFKNKFKEVHDYNLNFAKDFIVNPKIGSSLFIKDNDNILTPLGSRVDIDLYLDSNFKKKLSPDDKEKSFIRFESKFYKLNKIEYKFVTSIDTFNYDNLVNFFENQSEEYKIKLLLEKNPYSTNISQQEGKDGEKIISLIIEMHNHLVHGISHDRFKLKKLDDLSLNLNMQSKKLTSIKIDTEFIDRKLDQEFQLVKSKNYEAGKDLSYIKKHLENKLQFQISNIKILLYLVLILNLFLIVLIWNNF